MKIIKQKTSLKTKIIIFATIAAVLVLALFLLVLPKITNNAENSSVDYGKASGDQQNAGETIKDNSVNTTDPSKPNLSGSDQSPEPEPQAKGKSKAEASITAANHNGDIIQIRANIATITNSGTCNLTLKKGGVVVTRTAGAQALASSSTCQGFDIPSSEFTSGTWQITLHFENADIVADTTGSLLVGTL